MTKAVEEPTTAVALSETYPALALHGSGVNNLAPGEAMTPFDLERIKVPTAGGLAWDLGDESPRSFDAIILHQRLVRSYWRESLDASGGGSPDCSSADGQTGVGDPGGSCQTCQFAQWGSAEKGNGQACRLMRAMFVALPGKGIPAVIMAPPSSVLATKKYLVSLTSRGIPYQGAMTHFELVKESSGSGVAYSQIAASLNRVLDVDEQRAVKASIDAMQGLFSEAIAIESANDCEHDLAYTVNGILACRSCKRQWNEEEALAAGLV